MARKEPNVAKLRCEFDRRPSKVNGLFSWTLLLFRSSDLLMRRTNDDLGLNNTISVLFTTTAWTHKRSGEEDVKFGNGGANTGANVTECGDKARLKVRDGSTSCFRRATQQAEAGIASEMGDSFAIH